MRENDNLTDFKLVWMKNGKENIVFIEREKIRSGRKKIRGGRGGGG